MEEDVGSDHFKGWPFVAESRREDGGINNGAFNLVLHPEKIDTIHEATNANGLRPLLVHINRPSGCMMTLGCAYGLESDGLYYSYLEITIRDAQSAMNKDWPQIFEQKWQQYLDRAESQIEGIKRLLEENLAMTYRRFCLRPETDQRLLVCIYLRAASEDDHQSLAGHPLRFFQLLEAGELH